MLRVLCTLPLFVVSLLCMLSVTYENQGVFVVGFGLMIVSMYILDAPFRKYDAPLRKEGKDANRHIQRG